MTSQAVGDSRLGRVAALWADGSGLDGIELRVCWQRYITVDGWLRVGEWKGNAVGCRWWPQTHRLEVCTWW